MSRLGAGSDLAISSISRSNSVMRSSSDQAYRSSNVVQKARKRQYWVQDGGRWKIAYDAAVGRPVLVLPESYPRARAQSAAKGERS